MATPPLEVTGQDRRQLEDERRFLLRSIADLDAERAAGDISEQDYRSLRQEYGARAAAVLRRLTDTVDEPDHDRQPPVPATEEPAGEEPATDEEAAVSPRRRRRRWLLWAGLALLAAAAVVAVTAELTARLPGQTSSGTVSLSRAQQIRRMLAQAHTLEAQGSAARAVALYQQVLQLDPAQEQALAPLGWLEFQAGVSARRSELLSSGQAAEQTAEGLDPADYAPHLYLGFMLLTEGSPAASASEFTRFLSDDPPVSVEQSAWPFVVRAFEGAGRPVPPVPPGVHG